MTTILAPQRRAPFFSPGEVPSVFAFGFGDFERSLGLCIHDSDRPKSLDRASASPLFFGFLESILQILGT